MISKDSIEQLIGQSMVDESGDKVGKVGMIYLDDTTGEPAWATVNTGFFGTSESFVPIANASTADQGLRVPFSKSKIKDAPNISPDGHISPSEEDELYRYYGMSSGSMVDDTQTRMDADARGTVDVDTRTTTDAGTRASSDDAMTRSEEHLKVGTEQREAGRARLRKYVVTEEQSVTVPVTREEVRVEREPITEGNRGEALSGPEISEAEHEVVLHEETPVVSKETKPVERVRLEKDTVTEQEQVTEEVRKEQIEADGDTERGGRI